MCNKNNIIAPIAKQGPKGSINLSFFRLDITATGNATKEAKNIVTILNLIPNIIAIYAINFLNSKHNQKYYQ